MKTLCYSWCVSNEWTKCVACCYTIVRVHVSVAIPFSYGMIWWSISLLQNLPLIKVFLAQKIVNFDPISEMIPRNNLSVQVLFNTNFAHCFLGDTENTVKLWPIIAKHRCFCIATAFGYAIQHLLFPLILKIQKYLSVCKRTLYICAFCKTSLPIRIV